VTAQAGAGNGIAVGGGVALPGRFYVAGRYRSSTIDVSATITSPLVTVMARDEFDLVATALALGYQRELRENFDFIAELSRDTASYDFGSFALENFDTEDSGLGGRAGFRWNPRPALEVFAAAHHSAVGKPNLSTRDFDADTTFVTGLRWYFFEDLGLGVDYESGDVSTVTVAMRMSFGKLPW
jgi:hypothetical protein